jgi:small subunit ribosomal protein S21
MYFFILYLPPQKKQLKMPLIINLKENESIDKALKRFKKKFEKTGILKELRSRTAFEKPSVSRRNEIIRAAYKQKTYYSEPQ